MLALRAQVETRLREQVAELREVAGAASLTAVLEGRVSAPAAYVFREGQRAGANSGTNHLCQRVEQQLGIVLAVRNVRDARHGDSSDDAEALAGAVRAALYGWQPEAAAEPLEYVGGRLVSLVNGYLFWLESYRTAVHWRDV